LLWTFRDAINIEGHGRSTSAACIARHIGGDPTKTSLQEDKKKQSRRNHRRVATTLLHNSAAIAKTRVQDTKYGNPVICDR